MTKLEKAAINYEANGKDQCIDHNHLCIRAAFEFGAEWMNNQILELLRGEDAATWAINQLEEKRCDRNDAHITRHEWANWIEEKLNEEK